MGAPASVWLQIDIIDKFGLSATTTYSVVVNDVNDNIPVANETSISISVDTNVAIGTTLGVIGASDADATSPNNAVTMNVDTSSVGGYFEMVGFELKLKTQFDVADGTTGLSFAVYAVDGGTPSMSATTSVTLNLPTSTSTTTTTLIPPLR